MIITSQEFCGISGYKTSKSQHKLFVSASYLTVSQDPVFNSDDRVGLFVIELSQSLIVHSIN